MSHYPSEDAERFDQQFAETEDERNERLRKRRERDQRLEKLATEPNPNIAAERILHADEIFPGVVRRMVCFRRKDGRGTQIWGTGYPDDMEAIKARDICFERTKDATMVWALRSDLPGGTLNAVLTRKTP